MRYFTVNPLDVVFFRDGRESQAGSEYSAKSLFPPSPTTFYGAFRSRILVNEHAHLGNNESEEFTFEKELSDTVIKVAGSRSNFGSLSICSFGLYDKINRTPIYPIPQNILKDKKDTNDLAIGLPRNFSHLGIKANYPTDLSNLWHAHKEGDFFQGASNFVSYAGLQKLLYGAALDKQDLYLFDDIYVTENRMHVGIEDDTRTSEHGKLFTIPFIRLKERFSFFVGVQNDYGLLEKEFSIKLGGEGRSAWLQEIDNPFAVTQGFNRDKLTTGKNLVLYLSTATVFTKNGWYPDFLDENGSAELQNFELKLVGAAVGRYEITSGWNLAKNRPKAAFRSVPAGSVYFFEVTQGLMSDAVEYFNEKSLSSEEFAKQGLGLTFTGVI
jgi:CRISPR-associated protein Cmr3